PERLTVRLARVEEQRTLRSDGDVRWATLCPDHGSCPRRLLGAEDGRDAALGLSRWRRGERQGSSATLPPGVTEEPTHRNEPTRPTLGPVTRPIDRDGGANGRLASWTTSAPSPSTWSPPRPRRPGRL